MSEFPRRIRLDQHTPAEAAITDAMRSVESAGCDARLTKALVLLSDAREQVADFVDGVPYRDPTDVLRVAQAKLAECERGLQTARELAEEYSRLSAETLSRLATVEAERDAMGDVAEAASEVVDDYAYLVQAFDEEYEAVVDSKCLLEAMRSALSHLDALRAGETKTPYSSLRARLANVEAERDADARVAALYSDALSVIATYPGNHWTSEKAAEALAKTDAAREGRIYAQVRASETKTPGGEGAAAMQNRSAPNGEAIQPGLRQAEKKTKPAADASIESETRSADASEDAAGIGAVPSPAGSLSPEQRADVPPEVHRAGLEHARTWLPLTSDPATWPEEGQWVALHDGRDMGDYVEWRPWMASCDWTRWCALPSPPPSEVE